MEKKRHRGKDYRFPREVEVTIDQVIEKLERLEPKGVRSFVFTDIGGACQYVWSQNVRPADRRRLAHYLILILGRDNFESLEKVYWMLKNSGVKPDDTRPGQKLLAGGDWNDS